jgi:hypothetical protein
MLGLASLQSSATYLVNKLHVGMWALGQIELPVHWDLWKVLIGRRIINIRDTNTFFIAHFILH